MRAGVSRSGRMSAMIFSGGKSTRMGCGGVMRRSSQIAGRAASAVSTSGTVKVSGRPSIYRPPMLTPRAVATSVRILNAASLAGRSVR